MASTDASITIGADLTPMQSAFSEAQTLVKTRMDGIASSVKSSLGGVAATIAAAFAFKELADFVGGVAEARAHMQELAETSGTTVESLSQIQGVAKIVGSNMDDVAASIVKLTKGLATGEGETGKAANALAYLGISARNSDGSLRDAGGLYIEIAKHFADLGNGAGKTALAIDLFGKTGAQQIPTLNALGEAGGGVAKVTEEQARQAETYERNLRALEIQLASNKKTIGGELVPVMSDFSGVLLDVVKGTNGVTNSVKGLAGDGSLQEWGRDAALVLGGTFDLAIKVGEAFKYVGEGIGAGAAQMMAMARGDSAAADAIGKDFEDRMKAMFAGPTFEEQLRKKFALSDAAKSIDFGKGSASWDKATYTGTGKKPGRQEDTSKAEFAVAKAQLEAQLNMQRELLKEAQEAYDDSYAHNLISIKDYYDDRIRIEQKAIQTEIDAKKQEIDAAKAAEGTATTDRERLTLKAQEIKLNGELTVLTAKYAQVAINETRAMTEAERQRADGLKNLQIQSQINIGNSQVAMDRIALDTRRTLRQESDADAIQEEKTFEDRLTAIQRDAIAQRIEMEKNGTNDPVKIAALNAQLEDLERTHQEKLTQLDAQATVERNKYATEFAQNAQDTFATFFNDLTDRTKKLSDTFKSLFQNLLKNFNDVASKKFAEQLLGSGTTGGGILNGIASKLFPASGGAAPSGGAAAPGGGATSGDPMGEFITNLGTANTGLTTLSTGGIGGMFKSATDWIAKNIAGTVAQETQTTTAGTTTTALGTLTTAAYSAATALQSIHASGALSAGGGRSGASALSGLAGFFGKAGAGNSALASTTSTAGSSINAGITDGALAMFAEGTNYVPDDMIAMIHKGERITPAKYNNDADRQNVVIHQTNTFPAANSRSSTGQQAAALARATSHALRRNS